MVGRRMRELPPHNGVTLVNAAPVAMSRQYGYCGVAPIPGRWIDFRIVRAHPLPFRILRAKKILTTAVKNVRAALSEARDVVDGVQTPTTKRNAGTDSPMPKFRFLVTFSGSR